jgi:hypothetical protein
MAIPLSVVAIQAISPGAPSCKWARDSSECDTFITSLPSSASFNETVTGAVVVLTAAFGDPNPTGSIF